MSKEWIILLFTTIHMLKDDVSIKADAALYYEENNILIDNSEIREILRRKNIPSWNFELILYNVYTCLKAYI